MVKEKNKPKPRPPERIDVPFGTLIRMFVFGALAVVAASYAMYRYYFVPRAPVGDAGGSPSEIPIELEPPPSPSR